MADWSLAFSASAVILFSIALGVLVVVFTRLAPPAPDLQLQPEAAPHVQYSHLVRATWGWLVDRMPPINRFTQGLLDWLTGGRRHGAAHAVPELEPRPRRPDPVAVVPRQHPPGHCEV